MCGRFAGDPDSRLLTYTNKSVPQTLVLPESKKKGQCRGNIDRYVPQEVVGCRHETFEFEDLLHHPFHGHHFASSVDVATNLERHLPDTEIIESSNYLIKRVKLTKVVTIYRVLIKIFVKPKNGVWSTLDSSCFYYK